MEKNDHQINWFLPSGCITEDGMILFLNGQADEESAKALREHFDSCEFCNDALEGLKLYLNEHSQMQLLTTLSEIKGNPGIKNPVEKTIPGKTGSSFLRRLLPAAAIFFLVVTGYFTWYFALREKTRMSGQKNPLTATQNIHEPLKSNAAPPVNKKKDFSFENGNPPLASNNARVTTLSEEPVVKYTGAMQNVSFSEQKIQQDQNISKVQDSLTISENPDPPKEISSNSYAPVTRKSISNNAFVPDENVTGQVPAGNEDFDNITENTNIEADKYPVFPGGVDSLSRYLKSHMIYPRKARKEKIEGTVYVSFMVNTDGSISDVQITKGLEKQCDNEALRIIKSMPKWIPGTMGGKPVKKKMVIPVHFKL